MWTINDFPAYANLSGWSTKGRVACPVCANSTHSRWLKHGKKICYMGHRRWLEPKHSCRFQKERFDGTVENRGPPTPLTGSDVLKQLSGIRFKYGKSKKRTREEDVGSTSTFECTNTIIEEDIDGENLLWKKKKYHILMLLVDTYTEHAYSTICIGTFCSTSVVTVSVSGK
ncbi:basic helix-loop-helix leucine zipper transcription factor [Tanacetum coccineum]